MRFLILTVGLLFVSAAYGFDYNLTTDHFTSTPSQPALWGSYVDPDTGVTITRVTDCHQDFPVANEESGYGVTIDYTRKWLVNSTGEWVIIYVGNGASGNRYKLLNTSTRTIKSCPHVTGNLYDRNVGGTQDTQPEYCWDQSGNSPYRIFYRYGWELYEGDASYDTAVSTYTDASVNTLLHDFRADSEFFGGGSTVANVYNKGEGQPSQNGQYWCFVVRLNDGTQQWITTYDLKNDQILSVATPTCTANFTDMLPNGSYAVVSWNCYEAGDDPYTGVRFYPINDLSTSVKACSQSAHSGIAQDENGEWKWLQFNNCSGDYLRAEEVVTGQDDYRILHQCYFSDTSNGLYWNGCSNPAYLGHHPARHGTDMKGFIMLSLYDDADDYWGSNQLLAVQIKDQGEEGGDDPIIWRILSTQNHTGVMAPGPGESTDPMPTWDTSGKTIYFASNWNGTDNFEIYMAELPHEWWYDLIDRPTPVEPVGRVLMPPNAIGRTIGGPGNRRGTLQ